MILKMNMKLVHLSDYTVKGSGINYFYIKYTGSKYSKQ